MFRIVLLTDETLTQLEPFLYLIIILSCKGREWEGNMRYPTKKRKKKWQCKSFRPLHINQSKYKVLKQKNIDNKNVSYDVHSKKSLYIVNISRGFPYLEYFL